MINERSGTKYPTFNEEDAEREIVSMIEFQDRIYVATKVGVYCMEGDKLVRLEIKERL